MSLELLEKLQLDLDTRTIYIMEEIDKNMKYRIAVCMSLLDRYDGDVNLYINSGGGCLVSTLGIYDILKSSKNTINGYVTGEACSGASLILQACDNRYISKHSSIMIHYGSHGLPMDTPKNNEILLDFYGTLQKDMIKIYKSKMKYKGKKITNKKLEELLSYDSWIRAKGSIDLGLVDGIKSHPFDVYEYDDGEQISDAELDVILKQLQLGE